MFEMLYKNNPENKVNNKNKKAITTITTAGHNSNNVDCFTSSSEIKNIFFLQGRPNVDV